MRARKEHKAALKAYKKELQRQERLLSAYRRDSLAHDQALQLHAQKVAEYQAYQQQLRLRVQRIDQHYRTFSGSEYQTRLERAARSIGLIDASHSYNACYTYLQNKLQEMRAQNEAFQPLLDALAAQPADISSRSHKSTIDKAVIETRDLGKELERERELAAERLKKQFEAGEIFATSISYNIQRLAKQNNWTDADCLSARDWIARACDDYQNTIYSQQRRYNRVLETLKPICEEYAQKRKSLEDLNLQLNTLMAELGLFSAADVAATYQTALSISGMGWINCDRFLNLPSTQRTDLQIISAGNAQDTKFYLLFEDIKSVMPTYYNGSKFVCAGIPIGSRIKIVGLRIQGDKAEYFSQQTSLSQNLEIKAKFEPKSMSELFNILQNV